MTFAGLDDGIPVYVNVNGTRKYFKRLVTDNGIYEYIDFGEGYICTQEPVVSADGGTTYTYNATSDHLYLICEETNKGTSWSLSKVAPN